VIGVNAQILTRSGGYMGLSFAIPIDVAMDVADQLRNEGYVSRGWLGVRIQPVSPDLASSFGMDQAEGALIADLAPDGPAAEGGLQAGDIILEANGQEVDHSTTLPRLIGGVAPGEEVELLVLREGERQSITVAVGEWPDAGADQAGNESEPARLGIAAQPLSDAERQQLGLDHGVRIVDVDPAGRAAAAGIRPGDVLVSIGQQQVESPEQLADIVADLPEGQAIPVRLYRDGNSYFVALSLGGD
jgi:serine protease Do